VLLFLFVPETFWDRTPRPRSRHPSTSNSRLSLFRQRIASHVSSHLHPQSESAPVPHQVDGSGDAPSRMGSTAEPALRRPSEVHRNRGLRVGFATEEHGSNDKSYVHQNLDGHASPPNGHADAITPSEMIPATTAAAGKVWTFHLKKLHH
jgi:hypothetical protein